jgi:hypothetical protein
VKGKQTDLFGELSSASRRRLHSFAECAAAIDGLFQDALKREGRSAFTDYIEFAKRMSNLSVYNAMLVRVQRPGAAAVATEKKWMSIQRQVKPGAIPIVVLRPFGPVSFLYEVADTDGEPLPGEHANPFVAHGEMDEVEWARFLMHHREKNSVRIEERHFGTLLGGNARSIQAVPSLVPNATTTEWLIQLNQNHPIPTRFATLAHELGHIFCGHCGADPRGRWPDRSMLPQDVCEVEAEAVAYLACSRRALEVASMEYLSGHIKTVDLKHVSVYAIFEAANRVETRMTEGQ